MDNRIATILWADDDHFLWEGLKGFLREYFDVVSVANYSAAKNEWRENKLAFDVLMVDMVLPHNPEEITIDPFLGITLINKVLSEVNGVKLIIVFTIIEADDVNKELETVEKHCKENNIKYCFFRKSDLPSLGTYEFVKTIKRRIEKN